MSPTKLRKILTWGHFIAALIVGAYLYSPLSADPAFEAITLYAVFPMMAVSGIVMWNMSRVIRVFGARRAER